MNLNVSLFYSTLFLIHSLSILQLTLLLLKVVSNMKGGNSNHTFPKTCLTSLKIECTCIFIYLHRCKQLNLSRIKTLRTVSIFHSLVST